jgi:hypothetical protein
MGYIWLYLGYDGDIMGISHEKSTVCYGKLPF